MAKISSKQLGVAMARKILSLKDHTEKKDFLKEIAKLIKKEGKISKLSLIIKSFEQEWNKKENLIDVKMIVPSKEDAKFLKEIDGKKVHLNVVENKDLIAGAQIIVGDYISDNTIKSRLQKLKNLA